MGYVIAALVLVGLVAVLNLVFTYGVVRRLARQDRELATLRAVLPSNPEEVMNGPGSAPEDFGEVTTTGGEHLGRDSLTGGMMLGFFTPTCAPCRAQASPFAERARSLGRDRALVVVVGSRDDVGELVALFDPVARVLVEPDQGPVQRAFGVRGFPAMCVLDADGRVTAVATGVERLPEPAARAER
ncbi:hypothetical protein [Microbispora sp. NPDC046933]|uniref:TlpA family protein disulfide reductase n=1 Tax=Microbispora sp. NPDC046933 TaxID=3155618 RepID=UPI0033FA230A